MSSNHLSTLPILDQAYEIYIAFLSQSCQQIGKDNHIIYLVKMMFDHCLQHLGNEELQLLQQKEDMYLNYIMYSTLKNYGYCDDQDFHQQYIQIVKFYEADDDQLLFIQKIQLIIKASSINKDSPFTCVQTNSSFFSPSLRQKLTYILKYMIGHSIFYMIPPQTIFALCLKWTLSKYNIQNQQVHGLISQFIDLQTDETTVKLEQITQIMDNIMNIEP